MKKLLIKYIGPLSKNQHYPGVHPKERIGLHHTAGGSAVEAVRWWNQTPDPVGTALFVERDGAALQAFEIAAWAYACGVGNAAFEKGSVGIELVSYGFVIPEESTGKFFAYPLYPLMKKRIEIKKEDVTELDEPWRGFKFWHKYTDAQIETTVQLCRYLVDRFKIKVQDNLDNFWDYDGNFVRQQKKGIYSHTTVRKPETGKWDIYPEPKLLAALKAEFGQKTKTVETKQPVETKTECKEVPVSLTKK